MQIQIQSVLQQDDASFEVRFTTEFGEGVGAWVSDGAPELGATHVELELIGALMRISCPREVQWGTPFLSAEEGGAVICGTLESIDDGISLLRLGPSIVALGQIFDVPQAEEGSYCCFRADHFELYPTNL